ncbi:hypothetical protein HME9302_01286 [Alteripontixanthobacter maritimus]|uniref:Uncharacterized protein n=1 Tax=Alteripontixanthobacter maritimus TaxID=2161824 RepID=A0A369QA15_9SPHN|nr:hypothetical protein [Alteripontixanthobacter maritimus]RDC60087.1 hypothetical protein HME9302_01286 [Alteripontixanthobacter maritimus]
MFTTWPCPANDGTIADELLTGFDKKREHRLLVLPPLFEEHNKFRRQTVEIMRRLDLSGVDSALPDLAGQNESKRLLAEETLSGWMVAIRAAANAFGATHVFALRGGALLAPADLPGWLYAPTDGAKILRGMLRARTIAAKEAGRSETRDDLAETARIEGMELGGWHIGAQMFRELEAATVAPDAVQAVIDQSVIGGAGLWLRAEPDDDPEQADALAAIIAIGLHQESGAGA